MLIENEKLISEEPLLARAVNKYFTNITKNLNLKPSPRFSNLKDIINFYQNHISIIKIMSQSNSEFEPFHFPRISSNELKKEILNLNNKKATREGDIPVSLLKGSIDTYLPLLTEITNSSFGQNEFTNELKLADIIPIFKKKDPLNKENYRPVSILSHMSKVFERLIYKEIGNFIKIKLLVKLCRFRKNHNTQYSLISML